MRWMRIATRMTADAKVFQIAATCGEKRHAVAGHLLALFGNMTEQAKDGDLSLHADAVVEAWAEWDGAPGVFARAVRATLCDDDGVVSAWEKYQGAAIREAEADAESARARRAAQRAARRGDVTTTSGRRRAGRRGDVGPHDNDNETRVVAVCEDAGLRVRDDGEVDGSPLADLNGAATLLTSAVNRGVTDGPGESTRPLRAPAQLAQVEAWLRAGVDMAWAREWLYAQARAAPASNRPGSLKYYAERLLRAWEEHQAGQQALAFEPPPPGVALALARVPAAVRPGSTASKDTAARDVFTAALNPSAATLAAVDVMYGRTRRSA